MISVLDCGDLSQFNKSSPQTQSKQFGYPLAMKPWAYLEVANPDFIRSFPVAALQLN